LTTAILTHEVATLQKGMEELYNGKEENEDYLMPMAKQGARSLAWPRTA